MTDIQRIREKALRQFRHNHGNGFVAGYDCKVIDKAMEEQAKEIERYKKFLVLAAEFVSLCETKEKDKEKAIALIKQAEEFIK